MGVTSLLEEIREELVDLLERKARTKKEQRKIDAASMKKYGMIWRSTRTGSKLGIDASGRVRAGHPNVVKHFRRKEKSAKAKGQHRVGGRFARRQEDTLARLRDMIAEYIREI
jgi:hypothetical protein